MKIFQDDKPFFRVNLHTHTTASDGVKTPEEVLALYRKLGYDAVALTDHKKRTLPKEIPAGLLLLPGIELDYTFPTQVAHIVGVGISSPFEGSLPASPQEAIDAIREKGGRAILAHPAWSLNTPDFICSLKNLTASEIWNSVSTAPYNALRAESSSLLDIAAANGQLLPFVASDDTHFYGSEIARGWTMIQAEALTVPSLLEAMDQGRFYATQGPVFFQIEVENGVMRVECSEVNTIVFSSNTFWVAGRSRVGENMTCSEYEIHPKDTFVRCQIIDKQGRCAWSSPVRVNG